MHPFEVRQILFLSVTPKKRKENGKFQIKNALKTKPQREKNEEKWNKIGC